VDVVIRFNSQEEIRVRFILLGESDRLRIFAEEELTSVTNMGNKQFMGRLGVQCGKNTDGEISQ